MRLAIISSICLSVQIASICSCASNSDTVDVDVAIIGGGASGAHAAVLLRDEHMKSVLVIEKTNRLGGHVSAYQAPNASRPINYGAQAYLDRNTTRDFFQRFGVKLVSPNINDIVAVINTKTVDFATGQHVNQTVGFASLLQLGTYIELAKQYQPWFDNGYATKDEVPDDLLIPFGDFLRKHRLDGTVGILRNLLWFSDAVHTPTWTVMSVAGFPQVSAFNPLAHESSFRFPETHSSETLFDKVLEHMRKDVLLESTVLSSRRTTSGVTLVVDRREGTHPGRVTVRAKKLLIAATPSPDNTGPWDLDGAEKKLFSKLSWESLYVGVVSNTSIPDAVSGLQNTPNDAARLFLPYGDFCDAYSRGGFDTFPTDLFLGRVLGRAGLEPAKARNLMVRPLQKMYGASPSLLAFKSHGYTAPKVSPADLKAGFYKSLYGLQGRRSTFWTGLTWAPDYSSILWDFTIEKVIPEIVKGLETQT